MAHSLSSAEFLIECRIADAARGDAAAAYELGVLFSTGAAGIRLDLVEAHKWFNLASVWGSEAAQQCRCDVAEDMTAREIAEAQRQARAFLQAAYARAA